MYQNNLYYGIPQNFPIDRIGIQNNQNNAAPVQAQPVKNKEKQLRNTLLALGAASACIALGVGIYSFSKGKIGLKDIEFDKGFARLKGQTEGFTGEISHRLKNGDKVNLVYDNGVLQQSSRSGSTNFTKVFETVNGEKIVKTTANGVTTQANITQMQKMANKLRMKSCQNLGNGKISVIFQKGKTQYPPVELPEYLYHVTSGKAMEGISSSGVLNVSKNEQLPGVFLLDSENFLQRYGNTQINGQRRDLMSGIFRQAGRGNKGVAAADQELVVLRIPTKDLISSGKLRVRTQEEFFKYQDQVDALSKKMHKSFTLRQLCDDTARTEFHELLVKKNLMTQTQADDFIAEMTKSIHRGHNLQEASQLSQSNSVEYIFNHELRLADFPNLATRRVKTADYAIPSSNNRKFDPNIVKNLFDPAKFS